LIKKVLIVFGTRPEAIKMAPVVKAFQASDKLLTKVCVTAQHREMLDQVMDFFSIQSDYDLNLMKPGQNLYNLTSEIIVALKPILEDYQPDYVFVHGDTTTTMASSLAAFYFGAQVCHVEAGLRTYNKTSPFPEEVNRQITGRIADFHFAPTANSADNLKRENISLKQIIVTGNTVIDALYECLEIVNQNKSDIILDLEKKLDFSKDIILVTGHRRENHGDKFINICQALKSIANQSPNVQIVYPVHLNPKVQKPVYDLLSEIDNILLIPPLPYESFVWLMDKSKVVITDSGGIQEEAPSLGKPVLVMRDTTERPEAVDAGTVILVGTDKDKIVNETVDLLTNEKKYMQMSKLHNPYGDGNAAEKILNHILNLNNE